ncbi:MAG: hypothetical protein IAE86_14475 [Burkholderiaceae bacterium]|nr:hypothetical protein [Burkholderiaceae bacterium]
MAETNRIDGRRAFEDAVRDAFAEAAAQGWRELYLCDPDFAHWPLGESAVVDSLTQWMGGNRRLTLIALHYDELPRRHPRWVRWRALWAHAVDCRAATEIATDDMPALLLAPGALTVQLDDPLRFRGRITRDPADAVLAREMIDAILQHSVEALPVTTLGL